MTSWPGAAWRIRARRPLSTGIWAKNKTGMTAWLTIWRSMRHPCFLWHRLGKEAVPGPWLIDKVQEVFIIYLVYFGGEGFQLLQGALGRCGFIDLQPVFDKLGIDIAGTEVIIF